MERNTEYFTDLSFEYTNERLNILSEKTGRDLDIETSPVGWGIFKSYHYSVTIDGKVMFEDYDFHSVAKYVKGLFDSFRIKKVEV